MTLRRHVTTTTAVYQIGIVAHTTRQHWANELADHTGATHISLDNGKLGCTRNHFHTWQHHTEHTQTPWAITIEDDALPIPDFTTQAALALEHAPTDIVSFYLGRQRPPQHQTAIAAAIKKAARDNTAFITSPTLYHAVGVAIRTELIAEMLYHAKHQHLDIDESITEWARYHHRRIAYTMPSLLDHRDQNTIAKHRDYAPREPGRTAHKTGARDTWNTDTTEIA